LPIKCAAKVQSALDLAAAHGVGDLFAQRLFLWAQLVRQLELHVQVAVIDRTDFPGQCANLGLDGLSREACHTV
jgi:hypothetical protein